jgi:hypothetical protein
MWGLVAVEELPLPHHLPWWMVLAVVSIWLGLVTTGVLILRRHVAQRRAARRATRAGAELELFD